ncbi:MAG: flagellar biosynthetic protein FliQ [Frankiales bacterium]|jgi:flagellar biosynthetic protein FliQ|nr:flagellar biosynthetic protein FliQ [Frankiales bacterium]
MTDTAVLHLASQALILALKLSMPILLVTLVIGFGVSLLQAVTQIQEQTLSFVPKLIGVALVILVCGHWMLSQAVDFTHQLFADLPRLLAG